MTFDIQELIRRINEYLRTDKDALLEIVKDFYPYDKDGKCDAVLGLNHMNDHGFDTLEGEELRGRIDAFETVLKFIDRINGGE